MKDSARHILVVDDDPGNRAMLTTLLGSWGYRIDESDDGANAVEKAKEIPFDLILMDIRMLKMSGIEALDQIKRYNPAIPVIIMTAYSSIETAVSAIKKGAYEYLTKPLDFDKLKILLNRAMDHTRLAEENRMLRENLGARFDRRNIIGNSDAMSKMLETVSQAAPSDATILISGESGTGKELIAGAVHYNSRRKNGPFIKVNCAAITESLLESELFGHEKGSFTGADRRKEGRFVLADGGTLFLDEIGEMSMTMQAKALRAIQEKEITRVGGEADIKVDARIIAATNKNLYELIENRLFREDLYYRLNVVGITIPPLRERLEDIPRLAKSFLDQFAQNNDKQIKGFTPRAVDKLLRYAWPGNVRELRNTIERAVILSRSNYIDIDDITILRADGSEPEFNSTEDRFLDGQTALTDIEKAAVLKTLQSTNGNKSEAARRLGVTRRTLHQKLKKYGIMD